MFPHIKSTFKRLSRRTFLAASAGYLAAAHSENQLEEILGSLTLEEKARLCHGNVTTVAGDRFASGGVPRLGIGQIRMLDGRQGVRTFDKTRTTALPCTLSLSCTWDPEAASAFSGLIADEMLALRQNLLLAPTMDLMRSPLGGRNFEYLGEDPFLAGRMAAAYIRGVQKKGVGACAAHLVANDCETRRHFTSSNMDERTLREMHLRPFEICIKEGHVWCMMAGNNLLNGQHIAANHKLVQEIVKDELGYDGVLLTDWRAAYETVPTALGGTDLTTGICAYVFGDNHLLNAVKLGQVPESLLDDKVRRLLRLYQRTGVLNPGSRAKGALETPEHRSLARQFAVDGMVLLKNDHSLLPIDTERVKTLFVFGPAAEVVPFGGGSGAVPPPFEVTALDGLKKALAERVRVVHLPWTKQTPKPSKNRSSPEVTETDIAPDDLRNAARSSDLVLFFARDIPHGEGNDLETIDLPGKQSDVLSMLAQANPNTGAVLLTGGPVSMEPWADQVPVILAAWYAGESTGDAVADVLTGKASPGGKLSITLGKRLADYACHALGLWPVRQIVDQVPANAGLTPEERKPLYAFAADYKEGVLLGYRWFDEKRVEPRFAFGHGLSYTTFSITNMKLDTSADGIEVSCTVSNTGKRSGSEVVQVYVEPAPSGVPRPPRELKGFAKVFLQPGEKRNVRIKLHWHGLAFWDETSRRWKAESGEYGIALGTSSRAIQERRSVRVPKAKFWSANEV